MEGRNARGGWCTLDLIALQSRDGAPLAARRLSSRKQNDATEYGSAFARALELVHGGARCVFVSGTASIDQRGATVNRGDFEAQARRALEVVEALLAGAGARLADIAQATAFLKRPGDARALERVLARAGLQQAPIVATVADVCRDELLFEIDATAVVPARGAGATSETHAP
jgi:enamine deaminase RidA (YjgF/YER057c/UK114 family)